MAMMLSVFPAAAKEIPAQLPDPDGRPGDATKLVKVYILAGQSNMVGMGNISGAKNVYTGVFLRSDPAVPEGPQMIYKVGNYKFGRCPVYLPDGTPTEKPVAQGQLEVASSLERVVLRELLLRQSPRHLHPTTAFAGRQGVIRQTRPLVALQSLLERHQPGPERIEVDVINQRSPMLSLLHQFPKEIAEGFSIPAVPDDRLPPVAARHTMIDRAGKLDPDLPSHPSSKIQEDQQTSEKFD